MKPQSIQMHPAPNLQRTVFLIPAFGLLLIFAMWTAVLKQLSVDKQTLLDRAMRDTQSAAVAFEQHTLLAMKDADRWTLQVKYKYETSGSANLPEMLSNSVLLPETINRVSIANAAGDVVSNTRDAKPLNVSERSYFRRQLAEDTGKLDISAPLLSRSTGENNIVLARRLNARDGSFAGIVAMSVHPNYFTGSFSRTQLGVNGGISVIGRDGIFRSRDVGPGPPIVADGRHTLMISMAQTNPIGSYVTKSRIDGADRMVAYRALDNYPLIVATYQSVDDVLASFNHQRVVYMVIATVASGVIMAFFVLVTLLAFRLRRGAAAIEAQQNFLMTLVDNIPVGVSVRDTRPASFGKLLLLNNTAERILGISREEAIGKTMRESFPALNSAQIEDRDRELLANPVVQEFSERVSGLPGRDERDLHVVRAPIFGAGHQVEYIISITSDVTLEHARANTARLASKVFETTTDAIILSDNGDRVIMANAAFSRLMGGDPVDILGRNLRDMPVGALDIYEYEAQMQRLRMDSHFRDEILLARSGGEPLPCWLSASCVRNAEGEIVNFIRVFTDIAELKASQGKLEALADSLHVANAQLTEEISERTRAASALQCSNQELQEINVKLQEAQSQVVQSEKLASIGQLAAGVAHEINNPIGYVLSNFGALEGYVHDLFEMLAAYEAAECAPRSEASAGELAAMREKIELDYLKEDIPTLMKESKEGISRVRKIVEDLKDFSRTDTNRGWVWANLHDGINSTLNIVSNEIKYKAEVVKEYGELPEIECLPMQLNQVFMNLLVNAAHAVSKARGRIVIRSGTEGDQVWIEIADDGTGMPPEVKSRVFDPFFTTKPVGKGTGLGLSLAYGIVQKHNGRIDLESEVGVGTTFRVWLPIRHKREVETADAQASPSHPLLVEA